jgi:hypothetical protein
MIKSFKINGIPYDVIIEPRAYTGGRTALFDPRNRRILVNSTFFDADDPPIVPTEQPTGTPRHEQDILNDILHELTHCVFYHCGISLVADEVAVQSIANAVQQIRTSAVYEPHWNASITT